MSASPQPSSTQPTEITQFIFGKPLSRSFHPRTKYRHVVVVSSQHGELVLSHNVSTSPGSSRAARMQNSVSSQLSATDPIIALPVSRRPNFEADRRVAAPQHLGPNRHLGHSGIGAAKDPIELP
jgi:hypothetical protein